MEDAEVLPFPTTRQTLQEMLLDEDEKDFWDEAELAPAQEPATTPLPADILAGQMAGGEKVGEMEEKVRNGMGGVELPCDEYNTRLSQISHYMMYGGV